MRCRFAAVLTLPLAFAGTAFAASAGPQVQIDAADQGWAAAISLTTADFGTGWTSSGTGAGLAATDAVVAACPELALDESDLTATGGEASPDFNGPGGAYVASEAIVWSTADQAQADWDREQQTGFLDCFATEAVHASTKAVKVKVVAKGALPFPGVAPRAAAYRLRLTYTTKVRVKKTKKLRTVSVSGNFDFILVGNGRVNVFLFANSFAASPIADAFEQQLAAKVAARLAADPHA